jgi:hypothetical protein
VALYCPVRKAYCNEAPFTRPGCPLADRCALLLVNESRGEGPRRQKAIDTLARCRLDLSTLILHEQAN